MNNKEFISDFMNRARLGRGEASWLLGAIVSAITSELVEDNPVVISGFGTFEVRKKLERVLVNPATRQRMLVPPKMVVGFRPKAAPAPSEGGGSLQRLAKAVARRKDLSQEKAEAYLREFFDTIMENVIGDSPVKIKGLGTFKLVQVSDRESVSISTGERIVIPGHSKLSFTPDPSLKDVVNKPFADFQAVVINEGTSLEEMERIASTDPSEGTASPAPSEETASPVPSEETASPVPSEGGGCRRSAGEGKAGGEDAGEEASAEVPLPSEVTGGAGTVKVRAMTGAEKCALTLGVLLLCVMSYLAGYNRMFVPSADVSQKKEAAEAVPAAEAHPAPAFAEEDDSLSDVANAGEDSIQAASTRQVMQDTNAASPHSLDPDMSYRITGTQRVHVMKSGDYLTRIALEEYGHKDFARYIIEYNKFPDPDNIPVGAEVKLPALKPER